MKNGSIVYTDFAENLESYLDEWNIDEDEDEREEYRKMVIEKIPAIDWEIVEDNGKTYYIIYVL